MIEKPKNGMSITQVLIAAAAVGALGLVVASMMNNLNKTQANVRLANIATDLESRHRAATLSSRALYNSRMSPSNAALAACFSTGCPLGASADFELVDAGGVVLVPKSQPAFVNDAGAVCSPSASDLSCQWKVTASYTPKCSGACATPSSYDLKMTISWAAPPSSTLQFVMRPKEIQTAVAREMFNPPSGTSQCNPGEMVMGIGSDGTIQCASPIPSGAVMAFNLSACPTGWSAFAPARGRYVVGLPAGGALAGVAGVALANLEKRMVPNHVHDSRSLWRFRCDPLWGVCSGAPGGDVNSGSGTWVSNSVMMTGDYQPDSLAAPYVQLLFCQKN